MPRRQTWPTDKGINQEESTKFWNLSDQDDLNSTSLTQSSNPWGTFQEVACVLVCSLLLLSGSGLGHGPLIFETDASWHSENEAKSA